MSYALYKTYDWHEPLQVLQEISHCNQYALLHSGNSLQHQHALSFLGFEAGYSHSIQRFDDLPACDDNLPAHLPQWIGYVGYSMRHDLEQLHPTPNGNMHFAACEFVQYKQLLVFDYTKRMIEHYVLKRAEPFSLTFNDAERMGSFDQRPLSVSSNMSRQEYLDIITNTKAQIHAGNFYQANITRKFFGEYSSSVDAASLFSSLCSHSPSRYSALIKNHEQAIISSSPEGFLKVNEQQVISSAPIKGSIKREADETADLKARNQLQASQKDHAENLMIVDLMRHDLSRICKSGSVAVKELAKLHSFATIHHLISTIEGRLKPDTTHADILRASFPPGSMTGAPKIAAMQWCAEQEKLERGVYSGAIGWLGAKNTCEFSVVIRTIVTQQNQFEFQVGGGIVADSEPESEWLETLAKAAALAKALNIQPEELQSL